MQHGEGYVISLRDGTHYRSCRVSPSLPRAATVYQAMNAPSSAQSNFCGVVFGDGGGISHVPLLRTVISVVLIDVSCRVIVTQTYRNEADEPTPMSRYVFPVPSRATICAFSMMTADDKLIYAQAKDTIEATKEFEAAVAEGKAAALQEQVSGDIFRISLGSIPARAKIKTKTVFVMDLMNYDFLSNKVQLLLPLALGRRYGALPQQLEDATGHTGLVKLKITVEVQMSGMILSINSPSHQQGLILQEYTTHNGHLSRRKMTAKFYSTTFLDKDFELVVQANKLDRSRCFAEKHPRYPGTIALQLMLIPHFKLPPIQEQEYLFLIDRSGSMSGGRLEMAKQCVTLLLRCLPNQHTVFNVFDFESNYRQLWQRSRPYQNQTLREATAYVNGLSSDGGTQLSAAMRAFLGSRQTSMPTAAFILTDGEVYEDEAQTAYAAVRHSISASPNASLRLFILGIGSTVSSDVCSRLAAAGNGEYLLAVSQESILSKCTSLLRAGRSSTITDVSVDWTADISPGRGPSSQPQVVQQSPPESSIPEMSPSIRSVFFAIIHTETVPKQVIIRGKANGEVVSFRVDVETAKFGRQLTEPPFIHTLAAHRLIRDLEDGNGGGRNSEGSHRREIVRLGEDYQIASSCTSFVAVVDSGARHRRPKTQPKASILSVAAVTSFVGAIWQYFTDPSATGSQAPGHNERLPGGWHSADSRVPSESDTEYTDDSKDYDDWDSDNSFSTLSSLETYSSGDSGRPQRRRRNRVPSPQVPYAPPAPVSPMNDRTERFKPPPINSHVVTLVQQMSASGSFTLTDSLGVIVGRDALEEARSWGDDELAATALAMVYLEKHLGDHLEMGQLLMEKGKEFVKYHPNGGRFDEILDRARAVI